jgi:hypothetical protein
MSRVDNKDLEQIVGRCVGPGAKILGHRLEPFANTGSGIMGRHDSLRIDLEDAGPSRSLSLFVKRLPEEEALREGVLDERVFLEEVHFFREVHPRMQPEPRRSRWSPVCYLAKSDILVFEDLRSQGYATRPNSIYDPETLGAAVSTLARFHAASFVAEGKLGERLDRAYPEAFREKIFTDVGKAGRSTRLGFDTLELLAERFGLDVAEVPKISGRIHELVKAAAGIILARSDIYDVESDSGHVSLPISKD